MKKAVSLILALALCLALAVPAMAVDFDDLFFGRLSDGTQTWDVEPNFLDDQQGVVPTKPVADARIDLIPSKDIPVEWPDEYYYVMPGDTLAAIAFAFYGRSDLASALYEANKNGHFLVSGGILEAQRPLRIPAVLNGVDRLDVLGLTYYPVTTGSVRIAPTMDGVLSVHAFGWADLQSQTLVGLARLNQIIYIVSAGETLSSIATAFYGNNGAHIINAIKAANTGAVTRIAGDTISAGQYIILPVITIGY